MTSPYITYPDLLKNEISSFLKAHNLGHLKYIKPIAKGIESSTYSIFTESESYVLTLFAEKTSDLLFMQKASNFFTSQGFPFAKVLALGEISKKPALLSSHLPGKGKNEWALEDYEAVGFLLGNIHKSAESFNEPPVGPPFIWQLSNNFFEIQRMIPQEFQRLEQEIFFLEENWPFYLPKGLIHGDIWHKNILFQNEAVSGVLDFNPSFEPLILDLANLIKGIPQTNTTFMPALLAGYELARPLSTQESESLSLLVYAKFISTILYLLKKAIHHPNRKDEFQTYAFLNLLKLDALACA